MIYATGEWNPFDHLTENFRDNLPSNNNDVAVLDSLPKIKAQEVHMYTASCLICSKDSSILMCFWRSTRLAC